MVNGREGGGGWNEIPWCYYLVPGSVGRRDIAVPVKKNEGSDEGALW